MSRWTEAQDDLLLGVAGRYGTWAERAHVFANELYKRRDIAPEPEPAFTTTEIQNHFKELCEMVPLEQPAKCRSMSWSPKRTELLETIDDNTQGESYQVKTVLFNHAVKEKGWMFTATPKQIERKLRLLSRGAQATTAQAVESEVGSKRRHSSGSQPRGSKSQRVGDNGAMKTATRTRPGVDGTASPTVEVVATRSRLVVPGAELDLSFADDDFDGGFSADCNESDKENNQDADSGTERIVVPVAKEAEPTIASESSQSDSAAQEEISIADHEGVEVETIDDQDETLVEGTMASHLRSLVNNKLMSDVVFLVEGTEIFAHKCICVRINWFRNLLSAKTADGKCGRVEIPGVSRATFLSLLECVYTDRPTFSDGRAQELFVAADRYGIPSLKHICSGKLLESLCVDNAAGILNDAIQHNDPVLREKCFEFTLRNLEKVSKTQTFRELATSNPEIVVQIVQKVSSLIQIA